MAVSIPPGFRGSPLPFETGNEIGKKCFRLGQRFSVRAPDAFLDEFTETLLVVRI